jgi:two-component system phosphate regulon sensor histidine kinase PhoR
MQEQHYKTILYFIITAIVGTLAIQGYWNYKNFEAGKQQLIIDVQVSLDNAVNTYYATKTEERFKGFTFIEETKTADSILKKFKSDPILLDFNFLDSLSKIDDSHINISIDLRDRKKDALSRLNSIDQDTLVNIPKADGTKSERFFKLNKERDTSCNLIIGRGFSADKFFKQNKNKDSLFNNPLAELTSQVMYAMAAKKVDLKDIDSLLMKEFNRKNMYVNFSLYFQNPFGEDQSSGFISDRRSYLSTRSNSAFLPKRSFLQINFSNIQETVLKRNIVGVLISLLFVIAITGCLLYLLKVIKNQKQLAEIKNDLISNITHEFKTPLATISAAIEGIQLFNKDNDLEKTQRYAAVSAKQVSKLTIMVERLLETATLDSENLELNIEETDLIQLLETAITKESVLASDKDVSFIKNIAMLAHPVDAFHFENALNNLIDNALKYGGNAIEVSISRNKNAIEINVSDNGKELTTMQSKQIFDKFYRVPKGNTHDVKGFGIGLYYTKAIIEKHGGTIAVQVKPTIFKITLS